jgi:hypothetical protein
VIKTLQAVEDAQVVILVLDARQDIAEQDAHIAAFIRESGRALVVAVNKWDGLDSYVREQIKGALEGQLGFIDFARFHYVSALRGQGLEPLFRSVDAAYRAAIADLPTPQLTRTLSEAVARQAPPRSGLFRPKLRYAHQGGRNPPLIVIHGNALDKVPESYRRYLEHTFREVFKLQGTPLRIQFNVSSNPFADRKPPEQNRRHKPVAKAPVRKDARGEGRRRPPASQSRVGRRSLRSSPGSHPVGAERHSTMPQLTRIRAFSQPGCFGGRAISRRLFHACPCRPLSLPQLRWPRFRPMMVASQPAEHQLAAGDGSLTAGGRRRWAKAVAEAGQ